jgi:acetyl-CoA C-acetyltransferase
LRILAGGETAARAAIERAALTPDQVNESIFGSSRQAGIGPNLARQIAWRVKMPQETTGFTVNKACGSGLKAITLGAQSIMVGENEVVLAGGVEQMSQIPYLLPKARWGYRLGDGELIDANYRDGYNCPLCDMVMGETVDRLAEEYQISREMQDEFAAESHRKAISAWESGEFNDEVVPVEVPGRKGTVSLFERDERPRSDSTAEALKKLRPVFRKEEDGGTITAANASGITQSC